MSITKFKGLSFKINLLQSLYWMAFCVMVGFATVFLLSKDIPNTQIGIIIAVASLLSVISQFVTGIVIDTYPEITIKRAIFFYLLIGLVLVAGVLVTLNSQMLMVVCYCLAISMLYNLQPLMTSLVYSYANEGANVTFSFSRGLGSMMFAVTSFVLGLWLEKFSPVWIPIFTLIFLLFLVMIVFSFPRIEKDKTRIVDKKVAPPNLKELHQRYPSFWVFFSGIMIIFSFHTIVNVYLPQIVSRVGGGTKEVGFAIALAAFCEIPVMFGFMRLEKKFNVVKLLQISVVFFFIKSFIYLFAPSFMVLQIAQLLQSASFALITPAYAHYVNEWMLPSDQVKGQTFMMAGVTLGNVIGSLLGGRFLDSGGVTQLLLFGVIQAFIGMCLVLVSLQMKKNHDIKE